MKAEIIAEADAKRIDRERYIKQRTDRERYSKQILEEHFSAFVEYIKKYGSPLGPMDPMSGLTGLDKVVSEYTSMTVTGETGVLRLLDSCLKKAVRDKAVKDEELITMRQQYFATELKNITCKILTVGIMGK